MPHLTLPVDAAFEDLAEEMGLESVDTLLEDDNVRKLADVLKYHGERTKLFFILGEVMLDEPAKDNGNIRAFSSKIGDTSFYGQSTFPHARSLRLLITVLQFFLRIK